MLFLDSYSYQIALLLRVALAYIELDDFEEALKIYERLNKLIREFDQIVSSLEKESDKQDGDNKLLAILLEQKQKADDNIKRYFATRAYVHYKIGKDARDKELSEIAEINFRNTLKYHNRVKKFDKNDLDSSLGILRIYYYQNVIQQHKQDYDEVFKLLSQQKTCMKTFLYYCEAYYFLKEYDKALDNAKKALDVADDNIGKEIYVYDWLSRIAYSLKDHHMAVCYYEKLIEYLVKDKEFCNISDEKGAINLTPKLSDLFKYLSENKKKIRDAELEEQREQLELSIKTTVDESRKNIKLARNVFIITIIATLFQIFADHHVGATKIVANIERFVAKQYEPKQEIVKIQPKQEKIKEVANKSTPKNAIIPAVINKKD